MYHWPRAMIPLAALLVLQTAPVEALVYSTTASYWADRPELAMDGDPKTAFRSYRGFGPGDDFRVTLSRPVPFTKIVVQTGDAEGKDKLENGTVEVTLDSTGAKFLEAGKFIDGVATVPQMYGGVTAIRIKAPKGTRKMTIREITIDPLKGESVLHALRGPGRGFTDLNGFTDLKVWADKAEAQMASFWAETEAILYSPGFVPPNSVNVVYRDDKGLPPGMNGGGVMTVDAKWARAQPNDTGLTVHEAAHSIQAGGSPGWLVEATADYVRWIAYEPQNFTYKVDVKNPDGRQPYRTGAAFLAYVQNHYDSRLVTKLYDAARFGRYKDSMFTDLTGKSLDDLYKEFLVEYAKDPKAVLQKPLPAGMAPRELPKVSGPSVKVDLPYTAIGFYKDGSPFRANGGFDDGGAAYPSSGLGRTPVVGGVRFTLGPVGLSNVVASRGQTVRLSGKHGSLWLLGAAVEGGQRDGKILVTYDDGSTATFTQSFSDWASPESFSGEVEAIRMPFRVMSDGKRDENPFYVYAYGFPLDRTKGVRSVTLPNEPNVRVLAMSLAD